jgi:hypothetical protein
MTLTPLHVAFVWVLKPRFRKLHFVALTIGAIIPDVEPLIVWMLGWSVFCGWYFPCSLAPDRPVLPAAIIVASIAGAITTAIIARALNKSGYSFWLVLSNPAKALSLIAESLGKAN